MTVGLGERQASEDLVLLFVDQTDADSLGPPANLSTSLLTFC